MSTTSSEKPDTSDGRFDWIMFLSRWGTLISLGLLIVMFSIGRPEVFMTVRNMLNILNQVSILGMIAFGLTICLVVGLFDLAIGAMATFGGYFTARFLMELEVESGFMVLLVILTVMALAALIGMINGALISYLGISAIVETLAMSFVVTGVILGVSGGRTVYSTDIPDAFSVIGQGKIAGIPNPVLILLLLGVVLWIFLEHTQTGRNMYALGGNREASRLSGISFSRYALIAMAISGACAALGGLVAGANLGAGRPQGVGEVYLLNAFVAVFIGASTLKPGKFHILGTAVGVLLIGVINNGLSVMGVQTFWQYIVQGGILILALISASQHCPTKLMTADPFDRATLDFLLFDWLGVDRLAELPAHAGQDVEDWTLVLDLADRLSREALAPAWRASDRVEPSLENGAVKVEPGTRAAVRAWLDAGLHLAAVPADEGGMSLPFTICAATMAMSMAAHISASSFPMLSVANSRVIRTFGTAAQIDAFAVPQHEGRALGTMCLSEPAVGSSLGDVATRAVPDGTDDLGARYLLRGTKMWISAGGQDITDQIVHLVLAKAEASDGTVRPGSRGLSLFAVPTVLPDGTANDVTVTGLNHKMGWRGTPNCAMAFGERSGAQGWLIGAEGQGLPIMFQMMNEARIGVGIGAAALAWRGYLASRDYARERMQGRALDARDAPDPVPLTRHPDVRRMLLAQKAIAEGSLAMCLYAARLVDEAAAGDVEAETLLGFLTPIVKSWPSEMGLVANHMAIQIHGGYGYTRDFEVEQIYRDNRLNPIHEGTTGIQGIDLMGRKMLFDRTGAADVLLRRIRQTEDRAPEALADCVVALRTARDALERGVAAAHGTHDPNAALANATQMLSAAGHVVAGWLLLDIASNPRAKEGQRLACRYFCAFELPHVAAWLAPIIAQSQLTADLDEDAL